MDVGFIKMITVVVLLTVVAFIAMFVGIAGNDHAARLILVFGQMMVLGGALAYIIFIDSKKRWPGVPIFARIGRVMSFHRG